MALQSDIPTLDGFPFAGREREVESLVDFWRKTFDLEGIQAVLVVGEAGVGKSRLVSEVEQRISAEGGLFVTVRLVPESPESFVAACASALRHSAESRSLLRRQPEATAIDVAESVRRLARLRPLFVAVENVHLISDEAAGEFATVIDAVSDESFALCLTSRPTSLEIRGIVERLPLVDMPLRGISSGSVARIWNALFDSPVDQATLATLTDLSEGNPLAIRSALRGALQSAAGNGVSIARAAEQVAASMQSNVSLLSSGLLAHLTDDEKRAAGRLAPLGEVFAVESARAALDANSPAIDRLLATDVISRVETPVQPLPGRTSDAPLLTFTHSLIHRHLMESYPRHVDSLLGIVADGLPLYSVLPFRVLSEDLPANVDSDTSCGAIDRCLVVAQYLNSTPDWPVALAVVQLASDLYRRSDGVDDTILPSRILSVRLNALDRDSGSDEYASALERLLDATRELSSQEVARLRVDAQRYRIVRSATDLSTCFEIWNKVDEIVQRFPHLVLSDSYFGFLKFAGRAVSRHGSIDGIRRLRASLDTIYSHPDIDEDLRLSVHMTVFVSILHAFLSPEELQENLKIADEIESALDHRPEATPLFRESFLSGYAGLLFMAGHVERAVETAERALELSRLLGQNASEFQNTLTILSCDAIRGIPFDDVMERVDRFVESNELAQNPFFARYVGAYIGEAALLANKPDRARRLYERFLDESGHHIVETGLLLELMENAPDLTFLKTPASDDREVIIHNVARPYADSTVNDVEEFVRHVYDALDFELSSTAHLLLLYAVALIVERLSSQQPELEERLKPYLAGRLQEAYEWLEERGLFRYMLAFIKLFPSYFSQNRIKTWRADANRMKKAFQEARQADGMRHIVKVSLIGTITHRQPNCAAEAITGVRLRTVLGTLVANATLETPLTRMEFLQIASGGEIDPDRARKSVNMGIARLRELLGTDAIITSDDSQELNLGAVNVDVLELHRHLTEFALAMRGMSLVKARASLRAALDLVAGDVVFPGLYDDFFENMRVDMESRLRDGIIALAERLIEEDDDVGAESILRKGYRMIPEDEEIVEMLCDILVKLNRRTEAVRIRQQFAIE